MTHITLQAVFWAAFGAVGYAYFGYPLLLLVWRRFRARPVQAVPGPLPTVSIILPVHNEGTHLSLRLGRLLSVDYPADRLEVIVVSDGSTDSTMGILREFRARDSRLSAVEVVERRGKGNALNAGVRAAKHEILVFLDASIELDQMSLRELVAPFADPEVGCTSGEDQIRGPGGEGLYGRYELALRGLESDVHSIVGASGSFYALRARICPVFPEGLAPDFFAVLHTVRQGYRAISVRNAIGWMEAVSAPRAEFQRKVRTVIRGMTVLAAFGGMLNPFRFGAYSLILWSHKLLRWLVPLNLVLALCFSLILAPTQPFYALLATVQVAFYLVAGLSLLGLLDFRPARVAGYFAVANAAIAVAGWKFARGVRVEVWTPSQRP